MTRNQIIEHLSDVDNDSYSISRFLENQKFESGKKFVIQTVSDYDSIYINVVDSDGDVCEKIRISNHINKNNQFYGTNIIISETIEETTATICDELLFDGQNNPMY